MLRKAERIEVLDRGVRVKDTHHHFFAKGGRQGGQAHFNLVAARVARLDAAILRPAFLHHVHAAQQLDARRHGVVHTHGQLVHRVQHAVNAKADHALLTPGLQVNVAGALVKGVLPEPVHHLHHALVVGIELLVALVQLDQLFKAGRARPATGLERGLDRFGQRKKLGGELGDLQRIGHHHAHAAPGLAFNLRNPVGNERLGGRNHQLARGDLHRQHLVPLGVHGGHAFGDLAHVDLERVYAQIAQASPAGQPPGNGLDVQRLAVRHARHADAGQPDQRVLRALHLRAAGNGALGLGIADHAVLSEPLHQPAPVQRTDVLFATG